MKEIKYLETIILCMSSGRKFVKSVIGTKNSELKWAEDDKSVSIEEKFENIKKEFRFQEMV